MIKNYLLLLLAVTIITSTSYAQKLQCASDEVFNQLTLKHPELIQMRESYRKQLIEGLSKIDFTKAQRTTDTTMPEGFWYDLPIVVHVVHDYDLNGAEFLTDDKVFGMVDGWNVVYAKQNADTVNVIQPFKKWIGNARIRLHLATIDPNGKPTKGITRVRSYLTYNATDQSKLQDWPNTSYLNIWFTLSLAKQGNFSPAAYAYFPETGQVLPYYDGVISMASYGENSSGAYTINHEIGHTMSLYHPWGNTNGATQGTCADGGTDDVDDTPPTLGHLDCSNASLYDTVCASNYFKVYLSTMTGYDSLVDYPDTVNTQNIMDYSYCDHMFTMGQCVRMHTALNNSMASRNNLWSPYNLALTGALNTRPDLNPIPDFSAVTTSGSQVRYFVCPSNLTSSITNNGIKIKFVNFSYNDTITRTRWQFSNGAKISDTAAIPAVSITNSFTQPGWVSITMSDTGTGVNNLGTKTWDQAVFVADTSGTNGDGYFGEFNPSGDLGKWPTFNYYNNQFKWQPFTGAGYYDNYSMMYSGFDYTFNPNMGIYPPTGTPAGDYDDMYSIPFDLRNFASTDPCYLTFYYSGASRSSSGLNMTDSLEIQISTDFTNSWQTLHIMKQSELANMGSAYVPYFPTYSGDWTTLSLNIDSSRRKSGYAIIRFRYHPGAATQGPNQNFSSGNNFFIDRINFSRFPAAVDNINTEMTEVSVAPNPTETNAFVIIKGNNYSTAQISVSDITGKVVYVTSEALNGNESRIEIPQSAVSAKGMYIVHVITGKQVNTRKLVVY